MELFEATVRYAFDHNLATFLYKESLYKRYDGRYRRVVENI